MGFFFNRGTEEFERVIDSEIYVDKTDMLSFFNKVINTEQSYICVSRPRRFGKTITANMLAAYFEKGSDSTALFEGRKLSKLWCSANPREIIEEKQLLESPWKERADEFHPYDWKKNMNRYDVIRIDVADVLSMAGTPEKALDFIDEKICEELREAFPEVDCERYHEIGNIMTEINDCTGAKFIIIIDEWDAFFRDEKNNTKVQERYINLLRGLFKGNRSKKFMALAYITGILPIKKYNSESALNNFYEYTMTSPKSLAKYVGFSETEVKKLCEQYQMDYSEACRWYDGYQCSDQEHIFGPNSVVKSILERKFESYWSQTVAFNSLTSFITMNQDGLRDDIIYMMGGGRRTVDVWGYENDMVSFKCKDDVLTMLVHLGYLAYDDERSEVYIPNQEVRYSFERAIMDTGWEDIITSINESEELLELTIEGEEEDVAAAIEDCHSKYVSILKYNDENSLACVLTLAYYSAKKDYTIFRELQAGRGYADLIFLPKPKVDSYVRPAMVLELKWKQDVDTAIKQIKENKYLKALDGYHGKVILAGISYEKKRRKEGYKEHRCVIETVEI